MSHAKHDACVLCKLYKVINFGLLFTNYMNKPTTLAMEQGSLHLKKFHGTYNWILKNNPKHLLERNLYSRSVSLFININLHIESNSLQNSYDQPWHMGE